MNYPKFEATSETLAKIQECEEFIEVNPEYRENWKHVWETLTRLRITELWLDFAPLSFTWKGSGMVGGLIFHGPHDRGGDGGEPTFSVNLSGAYGWSIHT